MKLNRIAQSTLQYVIIAGLVSAGILLGGPYVMRSWNANVQTLEDSTTDSFDDTLEQANPFDYDTPCECGDFSGSSPSTCGMGSCGDYSFREGRVCTPLGCSLPGESNERCIPSNGCCTEWTTVGCGTLAVDPNDPQITCVAGQRGYTRTCGNVTNYDALYCENDDTCVFECIGVPPDPNVHPPDPWSNQWCPGAHDDLTSDLPVKYLNNAKCSADENYDGNNCYADCIGAVLVGELGCECLDHISADESDLGRGERALIFTSPQLDTAVDISVELKAEDLVFDIKYFDDLGAQIKHLFCNRLAVPYPCNGDDASCYDLNPATVWDSNILNPDGTVIQGQGSLNDSCGHIDTQSGTDTYVAPVVNAYKVEVSVSDADPDFPNSLAVGESGDLSYDIRLDGICCKPGELLDSLNRTAVHDDTALVTTAALPFPRLITVDVFTDNLNFNVIFYDENGAPVALDVHGNTIADCDRGGSNIVDMSGILIAYDKDGNIYPGKCGVGENGDDDGTLGDLSADDEYIDHYIITQRASYVHVGLSEDMPAGNTSRAFGWYIETEPTGNCPTCESWGPWRGDGTSGHGTCTGSAVGQKINPVIDFTPQELQRYQDECVDHCSQLGGECMQFLRIGGAYMCSCSATTGFQLTTQVLNPGQNAVCEDSVNNAP